MPGMAAKAARYSVERVIGGCEAPIRDMPGNWNRR